MGFTTTTQGATVSGGNVISGNAGTGVSIGGAASGTVLLFNNIGTDSTGTFSNVGLANQNYGVVVGGSSTKTTIGGTVFSAASGYALQVVSWGGGAGVPTSGDQLVVTGIDSAGLLHIRTFDAAGVLTDTFETQDNNGVLRLVTADATGTVLSNVLESSLSTTQLNAIATLKQQLPGLVPPHVLTSAETAQVLQEVTLLVGSTLGSFNIISGNKIGGIELNSDAGSDLIQGNLIGTNITGVEALGNGGNGIDVIGSGSDSIGGTGAGTGNVISSNQGAGVSIGGSATSDDVFGNNIGSDITRTLALGNGGSGIVIAGASSITIGSAGTGGNWIAGNLANGVQIRPGSSNNTVVANSIGGAGSVLIGNLGNGILIQDSSGNTIGSQPTPLTSIGTPVSLNGGANQILGNNGDGIQVIVGGKTSVANTITGNLVSRNNNNGIHLSGDLSGDQALPTIIGNFIGTLLSGKSTYDSTANNQPQGNGHSGILLDSTSTASATAGNAAMVSGNVISNNGLSGVTVQNPNPNANGTFTPADVLIQSNVIGTDNLGQNVTPPGPNSASLLFGNVLDGIRLVDVTGVTIGATTLPAAGGLVSLALATSKGNLISGNVGRGIELDNAGANTLNGNLVGVVLAAGGQSIAAVDAQNNDAGNLSDGIFVLNSFGETIAGNLVSNNRGYGIHAAGTGTTVPFLNMSITNNFIGTNNDGTSAVNLGNGADGVFLDTVSGVTVGGTNAGQGNVISGNHANGVNLLNSSSILIVGNHIGTNATGFSKPGDATLDLGNASNGVFINQSNNVTVGGTASGPETSSRAITPAACSSPGSSCPRISTATGTSCPGTWARTPTRTSSRGTRSA